MEEQIDRQASDLSVLCDDIRDRVTGKPNLLSALYDTLGEWIKEDAHTRQNEPEGQEAIALRKTRDALYSIQMIVSRAEQKHTRTSFALGRIDMLCEKAIRASYPYTDPPISSEDEIPF